jgi:hypothetical protein
MRFRHVARLAAIVASPLALVGVVVMPALDAGASTGGTIHIWSAQQGGNEDATTEPILVTGAIGDYGTTTSQDKNGTVDENGAFQKFDLKQGTFVANATALNKKFGHLKPTFNNTNCSGSFTLSGPVPISAGTGAYAGITGTVRITIADAFIAPRNSNGKCSQDQNAEPVSEYTTISGLGRVSF